MLEHQESFAVDVDGDAVWAFVHDMGNWAASVPGYESYEVIDEKNSRWTVKVKLGALTRTVRVKVTVTEWVEPKRVAFALVGETEPITGTGSFDAEPGDEAGTTNVRLGVSVAGSGSMASAMEAMSRPIIPRLSRTFAAALRRGIEGDATDPKPRPTDRRGLRQIVANTIRTVTIWVKKLASGPRSSS